MQYQLIRYLEEVEEENISAFLRFLRQIELMGKLKTLAYYYTLLESPRLRDPVVERLLCIMNSHIDNILQELAEIEALESPEISDMDENIKELEEVAAKQPQAQVVKA